MSSTHPLRLFPEGHRHASLAPLLLALTFVGGVVDAVSFLSLGRVFVANMTGNVAFLGFALAGFTALSATASLAALAAFMAGSAVVGRAWPQRFEGAGLLAQVVGVQLVLVGVALACQAGTGRRYAVLLPLALGMGMQNGVVHRLAVPDLTTTVVTRTLAGLAADPWRPAGLRRVLSVVCLFLGALAGALINQAFGPSWTLAVSLPPLAAIALTTARLAKQR
ncbi:YoaK family protein [Streptacidiphilus rugosus]|uniref:YoaK family protein n=1 Tax=Streptacidiphilus rugosus TaxID=405783 RepID=UPI00056CB69E|nr:YoaK family protein [Streptacidiphilus rugosus]